MPNLRQKGTRLENWLTREQAKELLAVPDRSTLKGKRDYVILALLVGRALRRNELAELDVETIQQREGRWFWPISRVKAGAFGRSPSRSGSSGELTPGRLRRRSTKAGCYVGAEIRQGQSGQPERLGGLVDS